VEVVVLLGASLMMRRIHRLGPAVVQSMQLPPRELIGLTAELGLAARGVALGVAVGLTIKLPADAVRGLIELGFPTGDLELAAQVSLLRHDTWQQTLALFVAIGLLGPLAEEFFYRGAVFGLLLKQVSRAAAVVVTSVLFALAHAATRDWLPLCLVALVLGNLRVTGGLWAATAAHAAFNSTALALFVSDVEVRVREPAWLLAAALSLVAAMALMYWARSLADFGRVLPVRDVSREKA
jgi:membrane protease YdiL (CAAX protease family)